MSRHTTIIAEAGVNHNGSLDLALQLVDIAADAGADIVKFQTFSADRQVTHSARKAAYQMLNTDSFESQYEMLKKLELTPKMHFEIINHCEKRNIKFLSTAFDIESVDQLLAMGQDQFKIPSGEITNLPYLRHIGRLNMPVMMSTGMANLFEITEALKILEAAGTSKNKITVLHCTSSYPTPIEDVNLSAMKTIQASLGVSVGYSDHTMGIEIPIAAATLGATVIEKHFTSNRNLLGPDHHISLEPNELFSMVAAIRNIETALGDGIKKITKSEEKNKSIVRKSIVAKREIKKGETFSIENITTKRPGTGISPMRWDELLGKEATRDFAINELIED